MTNSIRLRLSRAKGFDLQLMSRTANGLPARSVARPGPFGNPWSCQKPHGCPHLPTYNRGTDADGKPEMSCCVDTFREWVRQGLAGEESRLIGKGGGFLAGMMAQSGNIERTRLCKLLPELRGHNLACWCPLPEPGEPDHCHAAVLLELVNA